MSKKKKTNCGDCRYQISGFDGGFFGLPVTCECKYYDVTENRKDCKRFKRRFPTGFDLLVEFQKWFNNQEYACDCMSQPITIRDEDLLRFTNEWK